MKATFIWKNKTSDSMGLFISKLPDPIRAPERVETIEIPGRAGSLTVLEGKDVYDSYTKEIVVQTLRSNPRMQEIMDWLRGDGDLVLSNEPEYAYRARITAKVQFDRVSNDLTQAKLQFFVEPFKKNRYQDSDRITISTSGTNIYNPGNIESKPLVTVTGSGHITIGGKSMMIIQSSGTTLIDCDAKVVVKDGEIIPGYGEDFWTIPVGESAVTFTSGTPTIVIDPNWRWV